MQMGAQWLLHEAQGVSTAAASDAFGSAPTSCNAVTMAARGTTRWWKEQTKCRHLSAPRLLQTYNDTALAGHQQRYGLKGMVRRRIALFGVSYVVWVVDEGSVIVLPVCCLLALVAMNVGIPSNLAEAITCRHLFVLCHTTDPCHVQVQPVVDTTERASLLV
jgi:hypothetical protein